MQEYKLISKKGEGTFSEVLKAQSIKTGNYVAIKCMKTHFTSQEQVNQLREIQALKKLSPHPHIIKLLEVLYDEPTGRLALVFELMEMNLYELIKDRKTYLPQAKVKEYMYQLFKAIDHMHRKGIFHRDIKPENVLILGENTIKLADLGSCRGTYSAHPYTEYISTRWYRPPECLMTDGYYDHKMDIWSAGCVFYEILTLVPLFPGNNELDMVHRIHNVLGTPSHKLLERFKKHASHMDFNFPERAGTGLEKLLSHASKDCVDLLKNLIAYDPEERITAEQALKHDYFKDLWEADRQRDFQNSLTSVRLSPRVKHFNNTHHFERDRSEKSLNSDHERSIHYHPGHASALIVKKGHKKSQKLDNKQLPFLNLSMKVEGLLKQPYNSDTPTGTDDESAPKKTHGHNSTLPPIKSHALIQIDTKFQINGLQPGHHGSAKRKEDHNANKKATNHLLKPALSNQSLFKKTKKQSMVYRSPDYNLMGKKISLG